MNKRISNDIDSYFGYQKLKVYDKSLQFLAVSDELLKCLSRKITASDHLYRAAESIPKNIAYTSSAWSPKERITSLGNANGSALECAACLDIIVAKQILKSRDITFGKTMVREIVNMLIVMKKCADNRMRECNMDEYIVSREIFFSHEKLDVYKTSLFFIEWLENVLGILSDTGSVSLSNNLEKVSTGIVLNIIEGNGRFSSTDHLKFLGIAYKAAIKASTLLDIIVTRNSSLHNKIQEGQNILHRIANMIVSLSHKTT